MEYSAVSVFQMKAFLDLESDVGPFWPWRWFAWPDWATSACSRTRCGVFAPCRRPTRLRSSAWRFEPLCCYLPVDAKVGFLPDRRRTDTWSTYPDRRLFLAEYCVGASTVGVFHGPPLGNRRLGGLRKSARNRRCGRLDLGRRPSQRGPVVYHARRRIVHALVSRRHDGPLVRGVFSRGLWGPRAPGGAVTFFLRASLATGISLGLSSVAYFLGLFCLSPLGRRYCLLELAGFTAAAACFGLLAARAEAKSALPVPGAKCGNCRMGFSPSMARFSGRRAKAHPTATPRTGRAAKPRERRPGAAEPPQKLLVGVFLAALAFAVVGVVAKCWELPLGDWDAWAIWNLRARCLFRAGPMWRQAFSPLFQHTDYPLLVPATSARCWLYLGSEATWVPWLVGALLTFSTVGMLAAGVARLRGSSQGLLAGLVLLGTVSFSHRGAWQYADVPLAFFVLAAVLLLTLYDATDRRRRRSLFLSGLAAGLAAWTKNEGSLVLIAVAATHTVMAWRHRAAAACSGSCSLGPRGPCPAWRPSYSLKCA